MEEQDNILCLFAELCESYIDQKKACINQPKLSRHQKRRILQKQLFNSLFMSLKGPFNKRHGISVDETGGIPMRLYSHVHKLRQMQKYDSANELHRLLQTHLKGECLESQNGVLRLLLALTDTGMGKKEEVIGSNVFSFAGALPTQFDGQVLPAGPRNYGDSKMPRKFEDNYFMHFPNKVFDTVGVTDSVETSTLVLDSDIFLQTPGTGLAHVFTDTPENTAYGKENTGSLFRGLLHSRVHSLDVSLELPELPHVDQISGLCVPKALDHQGDEGYASTLSSAGTPISDHTLDSGHGSSNSPNLWDTSLLQAPQRYLTWESVGRVNLQREERFLSESGAEAFDRLCSLRMKTLSLLDPQLDMPVRQRVTMRQLVQDVLYLLIGVPSHSFLLDMSNQQFVISPGLYISGLSVESLSACCSPLLQCGSHYLRLESFSQPTDMQHIHCRGLVFQAFTDGIRRYLQHYRSCILMLSAELTLLELQFRLRTILSQIRFLAELCGCAVTGSKLPQPLQDGQFPTGMDLLSYVYEECLDASNCHHYPMLLSLLHSTAKPFLMFLQDWVFHGVHRDLYGEFMIQMDENYLDCRDESYWSRGYRMSVAESAVPLFLKHIAHDVFVCGKSINLIRIIDPQHFLLRMDKEYPSVRISFSEADLSLLETRCGVYMSRMREIARQQKQTRQEMLQAEALAKQEVAIRARRVAAAELERLQDKAEAVRKAQDQKKRKLFTELKTEMEKDLRRRAAEQEVERTEDAHRVATVTRQEVLDSRVNEELERQAREEMLEYYARLSAEATEREQRALWHIRRKELAVIRRDFMEREEKLLKELQLATEQDLQTNVSNLQVVEQPKLLESGVSMPGWAQQGVRSDTTQYVSGEMTSAWSSQTTDQPSTDHTDLPAWVNKDMGNGTMEVGEGTERERPHPSHSSIQDVLYKQAEVSDRPHPVYATDRPHPSQTSRQGLLKIDSTEKTGLARATEQYVTVEELKKAQEMHKLHTGDTGVQEMKHPSMSVIQDLIYSHDTQTAHVTNSTEHQSDQQEGGTEEHEKQVMEQEVQKQLQMKIQSHVKSPTYKRQTTTQIKVDKQRHATTESKQEAEHKSSVKVQQPNQVNTMSEARDLLPHTKLVGGTRITSQSEADSVTRPHIRQVSNKGASVETTAEVPERRQKKLVAGQHFSHQSVEESLFPRSRLRRNPGLHANLQSVEERLIVKKRNLFGHVSQLSMGEYEMLAPRVKKQQWHASQESDWFSYQVKCTRRKVTGQSVSAVSQEEATYKPQIRVSQTAHVSQQSADTDQDELRLTKFRQQNIHGHTSDSTAQRLLYGQDYGTGTLTLIEEQQAEVIKTTSAEEIQFFTDSEIMRFPDNFDMLTAAPQVDLHVVNFLSGFGGDLTLTFDLDEDTTAHHYVSLPTLLRRSITTPLLAQVSLVNESLLSLFHTELLIDRHFEALRRFMLMQDGEFGHSLSHQLFDKLSQNPSIAEMFNPVFLNSTLQTALRASLQGDDKYANNLSFVLKKVPALLKYNSSDALDGLELTYKVDWPLNIVISDACVTVYGRLFSFMLLLKRAVWSLKDVWTRLKRDAVVGKAAQGPQYTRIQLIRHEMQHFAQAMQGYISNQVIHVAWQEFIEQLDTDVHSLDDLHTKHAAYLYNCQARCLLNKKAHKVMQVMENIFALILKLRVQLVAGSWQMSEDSGQMEHPHYEHMCSTYKSFSEHSRFLYKVVNKIAMRGYKPYLQELINRLNFNGYYQADT